MEWKVVLVQKRWRSIKPQEIHTGEAGSMEEVVEEEEMM